MTLCWVGLESFTFVHAEQHNFKELLMHFHLVQSTCKKGIHHLYLFPTFESRNVTTEKAQPNAWYSPLTEQLLNLLREIPHCLRLPGFPALKPSSQLAKLHTKVGMPMYVCTDRVKLNRRPSITNLHEISSWQIRRNEGSQVLC